MIGQENILLLLAACFDQSSCSNVRISSDLKLGRKPDMDSIIYLLHNLTYRNVQILLLWLQNIIKQPDSFFTYSFKTVSARILIQESPPGFPQACTAELLRLPKLLFLFQCVVSLLLYPSHITQANRHSNVCAHTDTHFFKNLMQPKYLYSEHSNSWVAMSRLYFVLIS